MEGLREREREQAMQVQAAMALQAAQGRDQQQQQQQGVGGGGGGGGGGQQYQPAVQEGGVGGARVLGRSDTVLISAGGGGSPVRGEGAKKEKEKTVSVF